MHQNTTIALNDAIAIAMKAENTQAGISSLKQFEASYKESPDGADLAQIAEMVAFLSEFLTSKEGISEKLTKNDVMKKFLEDTVAKKTFKSKAITADKIEIKKEKTIINHLPRG